MKKITRSKPFLALAVLLTAAVLIAVMNSAGGVNTDMLPVKPVVTPAPTATPTAKPTPEPTPAPETTQRTYVTLSRRLATVKDDDVVLLQTRLRELGFYSGEADGYYSDNTFYAVLQFQRMNGLDKDGIAGPGTQQVLFEKSDVLDAAGRVFVPFALRTPTPAPTPSPTPRALPDTDFSAGAKLNETMLGGTAYSDDSISARVYSDRIGDGNALVTEVTVSHPSQLRGALAGSIEVAGTMDFEVLSSAVNAVIAIPGTDYLASREMEIRQGYTLRSRLKNDLSLAVFLEDGTLRAYSAVGKKNADLSACRQAMSVPAVLVMSGIPQNGLSGERGTALLGMGQTEGLTYLVVRTENVSETELAAYFRGRGCENAFLAARGKDALIYSGFTGVEGFARGSGYRVSNILYFASIGEVTK